MIPKPTHLGSEYGAQFRDMSVARAYPTRPPYPTQLFKLLCDLIHDQSPTVLDLGCGTGDIARPLAPHVSHIDAVDPSLAMLKQGMRLPGGDHPHIAWICMTAEHFPFRHRNSLVVTAESLHWMDWYLVLPRIRQSLTARGRLAIILDRGFINEPWAGAVGRLIAQYSTNQDYVAYNLLDELAQRNLFRVEAVVGTEPVSFSQSINEYIESFHSRNGLSRERMGAAANSFDQELHAIIRQHTDDEILTFELVTTIAWGIPGAP